MDNSCGSKIWLFPDCFYPERSSGVFPSHEAICVLNPGKNDANIKFTLYFEDREKIGDFKAECKAERTNHIRMDKIKDSNGNGIPKGISYAVMLESDVNIIAQYSRMDTTQAEMALMTTMGYSGTN